MHAAGEPWQKLDDGKTVRIRELTGRDALGTLPAEENDVIADGGGGDRGYVDDGVLEAPPA